MSPTDSPRPLDQARYRHGIAVAIQSEPAPATTAPRFAMSCSDVGENVPDMPAGWTLRPHIQVWRMQTGIITPAWHCIALHLVYATNAHPAQTVAPSQPSFNHVVLPYQVIESHGLSLDWLAAALISYQCSPTPSQPLTDRYH